MGGRKRAEPQRLVPGDGAAAAKRVKKEEVKAEVKVEPGVDEPIDLTGVSESDPDDDAKLADSLRGGPRTIVDAPLYPPTIAFDDPFQPRGVPVRCPPDWHTVDGANAAAERIRNEVRLLGVATLTLASAPGEAHARATLASLAASRTPPRRASSARARGGADDGVDGRVRTARPAREAASWLAILLRESTVARARRRVRRRARRTCASS